MANGTLPAGTFPSEYGQTTDSDGAGNVTTTIHDVDSDFTTNSLTTSVTSGYNDTLDSASTGGLLLRSTIRPSDSDFTINGVQTAVASNTLDSASTGGLLLRATLRPSDSDFTTIDFALTSGYNDTLDSASPGGLLLRSTLRPSDSDFSAYESNLLYTYSLDSDKNYKTLTSFEKTALIVNLGTRSPITGFAKNVGDMKLGDQSVEFKITI